MQIVIFTTNSARIFQNHPNSSEFTKWPNAVFDPDLSKVHGMPPQFWKLVDGQVVPMDQIEIRARKKVIERSGIDNTLRRLSPDDFRVESKEIQIIEALMAGDQKKAYWMFGLISLNLLLTLIALIKR